MNEAARTVGLLLTLRWCFGGLVAPPQYFTFRAGHSKRVQPGCQRVGFSLSLPMTVLELRIGPGLQSVALRLPSGDAVSGPPARVVFRSVLPRDQSLSGSGWRGR